MIGQVQDLMCGYKNLIKFNRWETNMRTNFTLGSFKKTTYFTHKSIELWMVENGSKIKFYWLIVCMCVCVCAYARAHLYDCEA